MSSGDGIFELLPVGIGVLDAGMQLLSMNSAMEKIAVGPGARPPVSIGALHPELARRLEEVVQRVLAAGVSEENVEIQLAAPEGERMLLATAFPMDSSGRAGLVIRDITMLREAERSARRAEVTRRLAGGIAHLFNNLLTSIMASASLITEIPKTPADAKIDGLAEEIVKAADRAAQLTRYMVAFSGKGLFIESHIVLTDLVKAGELKLRELVPKNATLGLFLDPGLPGLCADASQLTDLIEILFLNAVEAVSGSSDGAIEIETGRCGFRSAEAVYLEIRDNGCGIPADVLPMIFDPFFTTKFPGRGLGLAAAEGVVRGCGGEIQVNTRPGSGSSFRAVFPLIAEPDRAER